MRNLTITKFLVIPLLIATMVSLATVRAADHPTKEQVLKFIEEGRDFIKQHGKEAFLKEVTEGTTFKRGELYLFVYDNNIKCLAHGLKPALVGKELADLTDVHGTKYMEALRTEAMKGGGWVTYYFQNPVSQKVEKKLGYAVKADETFWFGSGTYGAD